MIVREASDEERALLDAVGLVLVADAEGVIAGHGVVEGGELMALEVEPRFRFQGIGRALVEAAVHHARCEGLSLTAVTGEPDARAFLLKCGLAVESEERGDVRLSR